MKEAIIQLAADAIEKLSFPEGILPFGIEGRKLIAEAVFDAIRNNLAPSPAEVEGGMRWERTYDGSYFAGTENVLYQAKLENGSAWLIVHGSKTTRIEAGPTLEDAQRAAAEYDRTLSAVSKFSAAFPADPRLDAGPSLVYKMHDFDDWGMIRNRDGSLFATVRRPTSEEELAEHRKNDTDPYEALGLLLVDAVERARSEPAPRRSITLDACAMIAEQAKIENEAVAGDMNAADWERTEARYRAEAAAEILGSIRRLPDTMPVDAPHLDDIAVDRFATEMKAKLAKKRADGYGGWNDPAECSVEFLSDLLVHHVNKGDPIDVGNFAMMIHQRGARIANDRERYIDMAKNRPQHKFEFPERERLRERIALSPDAEFEAGTMHPEAPLSED